ncbi:hypothetical protein A3A03_02190 [Candidatus Nomurabacteria bacterium RIFCSPLOWO2_01_FULL_40_18]|uniref:Nucleotidyl transferase AbiEii/AbiGii toxin family protein n=1 Tax=Candidatus Nomurabacteria bacterium RIFCSPLOWO2_01_FULL_40_18 TaxID=1801773 RepID=A0A1F6XLA1_9BACT|nr:MAG: hypothetical protein A3A03_02190 [Candidatus Nomurabacteria bacterium RIFCSPLOWO2_01_FULL_40_18]
MDSSSSKSLNFHLGILPEKTRKALDFLSKKDWLADSRWYLAGGTALALQTGHRKSVDLDFFTQDKSFSNDNLLGHFSSLAEWKTDINSQGTIYGELFGAKVSFIAYPFFTPVEKPMLFGYVKILKQPDIAVMKIIAISQRGRKRDFFDLYWLVHHGEDLENTIRKLKNQYPTVAHDYHHILKSLVYFEDAEKDATPEINFKVTWNEIKNFFIHHIPQITKDLVDLN